MENRKIKNTKKSEKYNLKFDSNLELFFYERAIELNVLFEFKKYKFELILKFIYKDKKIRECTWTLDFYLLNQDIIVDTKGYHTNDFKIKFKVFCHLQSLNKRTSSIIFLKNKKEVNEFLLNIENNSKLEYININEKYYE